jgi:hypothetical protein
MWTVDYSRAKKVTDVPGGTPIKEAEIALRPTTKILQAIGSWHSNRTATDQHESLHNFRGKRVEVMLFGDGHVANSKFRRRPSPRIQTFGAAPTSTLLVVRETSATRVRPRMAISSARR